MNSALEFSLPSMLIKIPQTYRIGMDEQELYDATRGIWRANGPRRDKVNFALAVLDGVVVEVYEVHKWVPAGSTSYKSRSFTPDQLQGRAEFQGVLASDEVRTRVKGASVAHLFKKGNQNPFMYRNC